MNFGRQLLLLGIGLLASVGVAAAEPNASTRAEIDHLLQHLATSKCEFYRNGSWYNGADARAHLEQKYHYLLNRGKISKAEDFIKDAATESSMSGKPYQVRCANAMPVPSAEWLTTELRRYRQQQPQPKPNQKKSPEPH